jgi:hypothetical protein
MRLSLRFAAATLVACLVGLSPAFAQPGEEQPKPEAELKKAQEQLEKLLKELRDQEAKKAPQNPAPPMKVPAPPTPPTPSPAVNIAKPSVWTVPAQPGGDAAAALKGLLGSKDPKTAALAKELLEQLSRSAPKPEGSQYRFELVPSGKPDGQLELKLEGLLGAKPGSLEFKVEGQPGAKPGAPIEWKVQPRPGVQPEPQTTERRVVVVGDRPGATASAAAPASGPSTLKMSADGKTAAVLSADGAVTIYDVASGKELMKFPGKK